MEGFKISKVVQNSLLAFAMACSISAWFFMAQFSFMTVALFHVPIVSVVLFTLCLFVAEDVRAAFKKVLWYEKRADKRPIWQVGVGSLFFIAQLGFVETFARSWMTVDLGGMPLYIVFSFMNAFLLTVIFEELFNQQAPREPEQVKFKKLK